MRVDDGRSLWDSVLYAGEQPSYAAIRGRLVFSGFNDGELSFIFAPPDRWRVELLQPVKGLLLRLGHRIAVVSDDRPIVLSGQGELHPPVELVAMLQPGDRYDTSELVGLPHTGGITLAAEPGASLTRLRGVESFHGTVEEIEIDTEQLLIQRRTTPSRSITLLEVQKLDVAPADAEFTWGGDDTTGHVGVVWIRPRSQDGADFVASWQVMLNEAMVYSQEHSGSDLSALLVWAHSRADLVHVGYQGDDGWVEYTDPA